MCPASYTARGKSSLVILDQEQIAHLINHKKEVLGNGASCEVYLVEHEGDLCCLKVAREHRYSPVFQEEFQILL